MSHNTYLPLQLREDNDPNDAISAKSATQNGRPIKIKDKFNKR